MSETEVPEIDSLTRCQDCLEVYDASVVDWHGLCAYCMLKKAFRMIREAGGIGAGEAAIHAECARQAVYFDKNPEWPRRGAMTITTGVCIDCGHFLDPLSAEPHVHGAGPKPRSVLIHEGETVEQARDRFFRLGSSEKPGSVMMGAGAAVRRVGSFVAMAGDLWVKIVTKQRFSA